jgi:hypothetical protein
MPNILVFFSLNQVAIGDRLNYTNIALVMRSCMTDGTLLTPSAPMVAINRYFVYKAFKGVGDGPSGEVWQSNSIIGNFVWHHVLSMSLSR